MKFISMLRESSLQGKSRLVPDPMEPKFEEKVFYEAFMLYNDNSPEDRAVGCMGGLIGFRVGRIFATLTDLEGRVRRCSYDEIANALVIFLNRQQVLLLREHANTLNGVQQTTIEAIRGTRSAKDFVGNQFRPPEVLEAMIDGACHVFRHVHDKKYFGSQDIPREANDVNIILGEALRLASLLVSLRAQWHSVLWYGAHAQINPNPPYEFIINKQPSRRALLATVDIDRREGLLFRDVNAIGVHHSDRERKVVIWTTSGDGECKLAVQRVFDLPAELRNEAIKLVKCHSAACEPALEFFLQETHPELEGVIFKHVLDVWYCLTILALQQSKETFLAANVESLADSKFMAQLQSDELAAALSSAVGLQKDRVRSILNFLTYKGGRQSLWSRPILATAHGLQLLWYPLQGLHLMRLLHEWGTSNQALKDKYGEKGHQYEDLVHKIIDKLSRCAKPAIPYIALGTRLDIPGKRPSGGDVGDVDGAFIIDDTLFILECRTVMHPAEAFEFWSVENELKEKLEQVTVKKNFLLSNLDIVKTWPLSGDKKSFPHIKRIVSLVVSNSFLLEGERQEEPYFVHLDTLFNVLLQGYAEFGGGYDEWDKEIIFRVEYLREGETNADAVLKALKNPVKAESAKACVVINQTVVPPFDKSDASGVILQPIMKWPDSLQEVEKLLRRCSFWQDLRRIRSI